jgi:glucuronosyltransferase
MVNRFSGHPKTKAFISHVGLNSLNEAIHFGVPVIAVPFFGDQTYNTAIVNHRGIGVQLSKREITVGTLKNALRQVLTDGNQYAAKAKKVSQMLKHQRPTPMDRFVHQVEFGTMFADDLLDQNLPDWNFFFYYSLDVIGFLLLISVLLLLTVGYACVKLYSRVLGSEILKVKTT